MAGLVIVPSSVARGMDKIRSGDGVLVRTTWGSSRDNTVSTVERITKAGKIRLADGRLFSQAGFKKESGWGYFVLFRTEDGNT